MITFATIPKSFENPHIATIQNNAVSSWISLDTSVQVILFGNENGVDSCASTHNCLHVPDVKTNDFGTPYVSDLFAKVQLYAKHKLICYVNCDIIFLSDLLKAIDLARNWSTNFLLVGQRCNVDIVDAVDFSEDWQMSVRMIAQKSGETHGPTGIDYFLFPSTFNTNLPPFLVGRPRWDNFLISHALQNKTPVVDSTNANLVVHQNHDYHHVPAARGHKWMGPEGDHNIALSNLDTHAYTIDAANWIIKNNSVIRNISVPHIKKRASLISWKYLPNLRSKLNANNI